MAELIDGRKIAQEMRVNIKEKLDALRGSGEPPPKLVSVMIGKMEDARLYAKVQEQTALEIGVESDKTVTAIIIQQPFPADLGWDKIVFAIAPEKDAEGIHPWNLGRIFRRDADIVPCTPGAVMKILRTEEIDLYGKDVVIVGHSAIVGKPLSLMMLNEFATTSVCHIGTAEKGDIKAYTKKADVLVVAVGKAGMVKGDWVKEGAVVIDVGINDVPGGIVGDIDFEEVSRDPKEFNKLLNKIHVQSVTDARKVVGEGILRTIPNVARNIFDQMNALKKVSDKFYEDNEDLKPFKKVVGTVTEELMSENPDKKLEEIIKDVGSEVRKRLELQKKAVTKTEEKDKGSPPRLPGKKKTTGRSQNKPNLSSIETQIGEMNTTLGEVN